MNQLEEDSVGKPLYSRFIKTNDFKGVPHPLSGDYTPKPQEEIDESLYVYGKKGPQEPEPSVSDDRSSECSTCQSNDSAGSIGTYSEHSVDLEYEISRVPQEVYVSKPITANEKGVSAPKSKEVEPSCVTHIKTPRQPIKDQETPKVNMKNWNDMMERELGEGYSFTKKKCFVCGSLSHFIKDCDYYEKKMAREAAPKKQMVFNTGNRVTKPVWNNADRINHANHFVPRSIILNSGRSNVNSVRPNVNIVRTHINSVRQNVNYVWSNINTGRTNVNSVRPRVSTDHPLKNMVDRGIFDSGCSGHMTGNKDQLEDFEEFNGGSVTFGGSKGYITGKGRIRVGNLDFDSVSFVKELGHFNLFSISQICDKQHKVLFTETECLVVSSDFKMPDENQILLKVPRHHNMYSFDMKTPTPAKGFASLISKAASDESKMNSMDLQMYALTTNPTIHDSLVKQFWQTATATTLADRTLELKATIDTIEYTITEASIRSKLQLANASGITISKSGGWDQFCSNIATVLICLSTGRVYNFSKLIFDGMVANLKSKTKFLMYPRFLQMILDIQTENKYPYLARQKLHLSLQPHHLYYVLTKTPPTTQPIPSEAITIPPLSQPAPRTPIAETTTASPSPSPAHEPMEHTFNQPTTDQQPPTPRQEATTSQLMTRIVDLEKQLKETKQTFGKAILTLVDRVKTLEIALKRKTKRLVTPSKTVNALGEEQVEDIKKRDTREEEFQKNLLVLGLDFEEVKSAFEKVNTGGIKVSSGIEEINAGSLEVNTGIDPFTTDSIRVSVPSPDRGRREGKAPMTEEEQTQASRKTKDQILQEEAGLAEAIRLDALEKALEKEEVAKQVYLDSLIAQRMVEEQELTEEQKKRKAQVQFEAQSYTEED
ncbi:hypothetical protein Tco_1030693 [Tanacetum coccineum]|uniref:Retrovirus-related Pol polyprotein from transposon TNT 1-94-like beta-barrel domain-containing protein n=1 Tax=Tanacetum coccineum TaxID=301880 RepID=A0ABQ5G981_9ASTR